MDLLNISKSRYTTKAYDPNRKILMNSLLDY